jgi:topoisomerase-4 subunit A
MVTKVAAKMFIGKDIIHIDVFKKNDDRTIYNMIYRDGRKGNVMVKRFAVKGVTRDKEYDLTKGTDGTKILYFSVNPNGEAEGLKIYLRPKPRLKKLSFDYDFSELAIKGRSSKGNTLTKHSVKSIIKREDGVSTLGARDIWYDDIVRRLNSEERGTYLGAFKGEDKIFTVMQSGCYRIMNYDLSNHFDEDMIRIEKFDERKIISTIYYDGEIEKTYLKRFQVEVNGSTNKKVDFIGEHPESKMLEFSMDYLPILEVVFDKKANNKEIENETINVDEFIGVKSYKAKGKRISNFSIKKISWLESLPYEIPEEEVKETEEKNSQIEFEEKNDKPEEQDKTTEIDLSDDDAQQMTLEL